jgi:hypothetical protein
MPTAPNLKTKRKNPITIIQAQPFRLVTGHDIDTAQLSLLLLCYYRGDFPFFKVEVKPETDKTDDKTIQ